MSCNDGACKIITSCCDDCKYQGKAKCRECIYGSPDSMKSMFKRRTDSSEINYEA